jgi:hypothetical protein
MAVSIVRGPDGRQHEVQHPKGIASSQIIKYAQRQIASSANAEDGFIEDVGKGLFTGGSQAAVNSAAGVTQWMGQSFGSDSLLQAAEDMRQYSQGIGDYVGLDEDFRQSFFGQVVQGLGQVPVTIGAGAAGLALAGPAGMIGAAAITTGGQMSSEFLTDMEQTLGKGYTEFNPEEKANALTGMLAQTALGTALETAAVGKALKPLLRKLETTGVSGKVLKKAIGKDRSALREFAEAAGTEGLTEATQGQSLDTLASMLYDEERELITMNTLKRRAMEFGVGAVVGGTVSGGAQLIGGAPSAPSSGKKADLKKPVQERSELTIPDSVTVTYKPIDGPVKTVSLAIDPGQDVASAVEEELAGRYDTTYPMTIDQAPAPVPVGSEQTFDLPNQAPDPTQEQVPVQPEAAVEQVPEAAVPTPEQAPAVEEDSFPVFPDPSVETQPEFDPFADPEPEQAPEARSFSLPKNLKKGKPGYQKTQNVKFASDLERAAYSATTSTRSEPGKRKREQYRARLQKAGYSSAEINEMGREVRSQMRDQYDGPGSELSVDLNKNRLLPSDFEDDITADAANGLEVQRQVQFDDNEALNALPKKEKAKFNRHKDKPIERGAVRLNLGSAFSKEGVPGKLFVQTLHPIKRTGTPNYGKAHSYGRAFTLRNATFSVNPFAKTIIRSKAENKYPMASVDGDVVTDAEPNLEGEVLSFNPFANDSFVDSQGRVVTGADEVTVYGTKAYARGNIQYAEESPEVVTASEILSLAKQGKKYVHPKFHPKGVSLDNISELQIQKLEALAAEESPDVVAEAAPSKPKAKKVTRDYDLLSSPFIRDYSGPGPTDTSVPDYNSFHYVVSNPQQQELNAAIASGAVDNLADQVANEAAVMMNDPAISAGIGWYGRMRKRLKEIFGDDINIFTQLLGTTSAQTPVETNFRFSVDLYNRFKAGEFDKKIKKYLQLSGLMKAGTLGDLLLKDKVKNSKGVLYTPEMIKKSDPSALLSSAAEHYKLLPAQTSGKKYGTNSYPALKALSQVWFDERLGKNRMTPKTPQFTMNLNGESLEATIDVWAARLLRRVIYADQGESRILPSEETAVNNPDFALGQLVFRRAAEKLNMNPDDLQALVWFGEKQIWDRNGWTGAAGALKSSFDEPADVFYPVDGSTRTEADAKLILDFLSKERLVKRNIDFPDAVSKASQNKTRKDYDQFLRKSVIADYLEYRGSGAVYESSAVQRTGEQQGESQEDVTAQATDTEVEDRGPRDTYDNGGQVQDAIEKEFDPIGKKINTPIVMRMGKTDYVARYNATRGIIEYNPMLLLKRSKAGVRAAMREEIIHAAMHQVLMVSARKKFSMAEGGKVWTDFFDAFGQSLTDAERSDIKDVYQSLDPEDYVGHGSEYSRAVIQNLLYGEFSEQYQMESQGGPAWNAIVKLLRSVQAYMAKVLGPMIKTNPEAAQVIVDSVELLKAADPSIRPKSQDVVAKAYDATDKNTAKENTEAGETVGKDSSERIREERKWFDGAFRKTASKYLTPVITRLNRINPMFGRILQNLDTAIRTRSFQYRKQTEMFFNKLNAVKGAEFQELKQLIFFSPTPEEANLPSNKAKMQRRDALLHKHGLLNMYRLDVQPILEEIYTEYNALGMPKIGYLEDYFPRVIKDLEGLIKSYGHKTKRTFEMLVNEENIRRSEMKDADGNPAPLPEMQETERARFFQDFLQGKFRLDLNGVKLPGNVKAREIQLIPEDKLKFYDDPGVAFGKYTTNMARAIESFKVVGDTKKGEGRLLGSLGQLTEELFSSGQIDWADANELKSLTELITSQFQAENEILKSLGTLTYMATLINPGPVLVQIMDLYKVALYRGLGGVVSGTYRTVTGNRRFDIERDFSIAKTQLSAEFEDPSVLQKALDFGLSRLVPFRQMDTAMKHASIEAAYNDFVKKAKAPVGSKKYQQLLDELTITMGPQDALKTIADLRLDKAAESPFVKEALLAELLQRQPMTYLQVPEGYQTDPSKRLFYKLSTFMLLDLNYNRQEFMNDLGGPGKTLQQRTVALRRLAYMATLLTMFGLPSDLLDDWIAGKDTYIPEHVMNNMLGMFGLSKYTTTRALEKGAVESVIQRFTPPAINIMIQGESSLRSWVKGNTELSDMKAWRNAPLSDVWYYRTGGGVESQRKYQKKQKKEGITPTFDR